jgi:hypothetical protein
MLAWLIRAAVVALLWRLFQGGRNRRTRPGASGFDPGAARSGPIPTEETFAASDPRPGDIVDGDFEEIPTERRGQP